jgi:hypothetical protein
MKTKTEYLNEHKITIIQEPSDDISENIKIDVNTIRRNPYINNADSLSVEIEPDIAKHFKNARQVNTFLRKHIKEIELEVG